MSIDRQPRSDTHRVTRALHGIAQGNQAAEEELISLVYGQLRRIAQNRMSAERADHSLQATELVHEAYMRMAGGLSERDWNDRAHFYRSAAEAMRRILIDYARARGSAKRGGGQRRVVVDVLDLAQESDPEAILAMDDAVQRLEAEDEQLGQIVRFRFYAGLSVEETAQVMDISKRSVVRYWTLARAWLYDALEECQPKEPPPC